MPVPAPQTRRRIAAAREADDDDVSVTTVGAHLVHVFRTGAGDEDVLLWGALQGGAWESLDHRAGAFAAEAGLQPRLPALRPWLRAGYFQSSGDDDAADGEHGTFFQVLPTLRIYARFPFYNLMNVRDAFATLVLRPDPRVTVRGDAHALRLSERADLWYSGGGAFEDETFGYAGRPSGGSDDLATLFDVGADFRLTSYITLSGYLGVARGGEVIEAIYPGGDGRFVYLDAAGRAKDGTKIRRSQPLEIFGCVSRAERKKRSRSSPGTGVVMHVTSAWRVQKLRFPGGAGGRRTRTHRDGRAE
ncbi:MAG TPA: alginate export family protein [Longimicrobium sp.]|nr:alginate export family protein [Longimicrobium sp.]